MEDNTKSQKKASVAFGNNIDVNLIEALKQTMQNMDSVNMQKSQSTEPSPLMRAIGMASGSAKKKAPALAYTQNPITNDSFLGIYKLKRGLLPNEVIKQISIHDHLVAAILRTRGNMLSLFGHVRKDRFDIGIEIKIKPEFYKILTTEQFAKIQDRMKKFEVLLLNCGYTQGLEHQDRMTLAEFLDISTRNGLRFGYSATEIIYDRSGPEPEDGKWPFNRFRARDAGTIYSVIKKDDAMHNQLRMAAIQDLERMSGRSFGIDLDKLKEDAYAWIQDLPGGHRQAFTHDEMLVHNYYPSTDVEHAGYPVSPLDTIVNSVTTHISIDAYRKLYFQNGRASKGMLVINSDELDEAQLNNIKLQFDAAANSVSNSFRTPVFSIPSTDKINWLSTMGEGLSDNDFQYISDDVSRIIMSAFGMSPDELPGFSHLSKGTNSQTLSESSSEFKLTAARDSGLRPLILKWQTFLNQRLFPIMDPQLSQLCEIHLSGLDAQSKDQESARLQQDSTLHMTYDGLLNDVDKDQVGAAFGGDVPFNERYQGIMNSYMTVGSVRSRFFNDPAAMVDPLLQFNRDAFQMQWLQFLGQANPSALQAFFAPKPYAIDFLKMNIQDMLEED